MTSPQPELDTESGPGPGVYVALFLVTCATLLLELGLTRIFSVLLYYHMAFFAVSVTLFGLALGGVIVHFFPRTFTVEATPIWIARMSILFAVAIVGALLLMLSINFRIGENRILLPQLVLVGAVLAVPFTASGVVVALALTRYPPRTTMLYGVDLAGAALGCLLYAPLIRWLGGPGFVLGIAALPAVAGAVASLGPRKPKAEPPPPMPEMLSEGAQAWTGKRPERSAERRWAALSVAIGLAVVALVATREHNPLAQIRYMRGVDVGKGDWMAFDEWNAISRIVAFRHEGTANGVAPELVEHTRRPQIMMTIDTLAATPILEFDGASFDEQFYAFRDIAYAVHSVAKPGKVAVIGVGGGRDILAAKAWGHPEVVGIEINDRVLEALTERFADFAGRPQDWPGVKLVQDEARSYITRSGEDFDVIQASLIDTFAATSAGAFVLTESSLYTLEGWDAFLDHLSPEGILTMTRWYTPEYPVESIRLLALARAALEADGAADFKDHILMARTPQPANPDEQPLATILVKKTPFTEREVENFSRWIRANHLIELVRPDGAIDPELRGVMEAEDLDVYVATHQFDVSPPRDDKPFFFDMLRWRDILRPEFRRGNAYLFAINFKPIFMLGTLLLTVVVLAVALIMTPLWLEKRTLGPSPLGRARRASLILYFVMLGLGYLMVELTLLQRFSIFLGHPSYSLTVVLFTMLLASGLGAMSSRAIFRPLNPMRSARQLVGLNLMIFLLLLGTLFAVQWVVGNWATASTPVRMVLAGATIAPAAFFMGMPFPLAIQAASRHPRAPLSWYWGINGAMSVCASVLTVVLAHTVGLTWAFLIGAACYLIASATSRAFGPLPGRA